MKEAAGRRWETLGGAGWAPLGILFAYTTRMPTLPSVPRAPRWLPEGLLLLPVLAAIRQLPALPSGDHPAAALVSGPDAGAWAINAIAVASGDFDQVDPHRLPTFLFLLVAASGVTGDIPQAGHLVGMLAWLTMVVATTLLGRAAGGPLVGAIAGMIVTGPAPLLHAATRFSVDPVIAAILPLSLAAVAPARRWWWLALPAGMMGGVAMCTHLTAVPYVLPALLLLLLRGGRPGEALRHTIGRPLLYVAGVVAVLGIINMLFVSVGQTGFVSAISEGISSQRAIGTTNHHVGSGRSGRLTSDAWTVLRANSTTAWHTGATLMLKPWFWPGVSWVLLQCLFWLGVLGIAFSSVASKSARSVRADRRRSGWQGLDLKHGIVLLLCLAPIPLFAASNAPPRYGTNLLPFVAVLLARGCASPVALVGRVGGDYVRAATSIAAVALLIPLLQSVQDFSAGSIPPISEKDKDIVLLTQALKEHFPGDSAIVTPVIESAAMLSRPHCPRMDCWGASVHVCLIHIRRSCTGEGPIPLVWLQQGPSGMGDDSLSQDVGAFVAERYGIKGTVSTASMRAVLVALPRDADD